MAVQLISMTTYPVRPESQAWFEHLAKQAQATPEIVCVEMQTADGPLFLPLMEVNTNPPKGSYRVRESRKGVMYNHDKVPG